MKTQHLTFLLIASAMIFSSCNKNDFGEGNGAVTFYVCDDAAYCGGVTVSINGKSHTMTKYKVYCLDPEEDDKTDEAHFQVVLPEGSYDYTVTANSGGSYSGSVFISEGDLTLHEVSGSRLGCSGGGGGGGNPPSNYDVQGTIYVKSTTIQIKFWDGGQIDNDRIKVIFNGDVVAENLLLTGSKQTLTVSSMPANSWLGVIAIDEGSVPPCTPDVEVCDGFGCQVFVIRSYINEPGAYIIKLN